jgi:hypothetical protein
MPSPIIVSVSPVTGVGVTRRTYYRRLADELGFYHATTASTTASVGEAARIVIADEFRSDDVGAEFLGEPWVYIATGAQAGSQRRMVMQQGVGYVGQHGALVLSRPFDAAVAAGSVVEVTSPLPVVRSVVVKGLVDCVNEALSYVWVLARLTVTGNDEWEYDLAAYPWMKDPDQIRTVEDFLSYGTERPAFRSPYPVRMISNGVDRSIVTDVVYSSTQTFTLDVFVKADRLIYDGSTWSFVTQPGLQGDTWQAAASEESVLAFGMLKSLQFLARMIAMRNGLDPEARKFALAEVLERKRTWALAAARISRLQHPQPLAQGARALVSGTTEDWSWGWRE